MTQQERRLCSRNTLNPIPHIALPSENGGIVLDVSEHGLRFRALAPVEESGPIQFSFSAHSNRIAGVAELVWTDQTKKIGGLRFTELSRETREQIRQWPAESSWKLDIGSDLTLHISAVEKLSLGMSIRIALVSLFSARKRSLSLAISATMVMTALSVTSYIHYQKTGEWLGRRGTSAAAVTNRQTEAQSPASDLNVQPARNGNALGDTLGQSDTEKLAVTLPAAAASPESPKKKNEAVLPSSAASEASARIRKSATPGNVFFVQIAALTHEADARKLADTLRRENFQAIVRALPVDSLQRVMLGPYTDVESANITVDKLKKAGFDSFIRRESVSK